MDDHADQAITPGNEKLDSMALGTPRKNWSGSYDAAKVMDAK